MDQLPWLSEDQRLQLKKVIEDVAVTECMKRHWGGKARGKSKGQVSRMYVSDIRGLLLVSGVIRYTLNQFNTDIFYRGQTKDYSLVPSVYRGVGSKKELDSRQQWLFRALDTLKLSFDMKGEDDEREALAQHYGLPTRWLDVVDHVQTAAWFAYHRSNQHDIKIKYDEYSCDPDRCSYDDDVGYIYILAAPRDCTHKCIDLRLKPSNWLRPHLQQALALRPMTACLELGRLYWLNVITFVVPRSLLHAWSNYDVLTPEALFPNLYQDDGLRYWLNAKQTLIDSGIGIKF